MTKEKLFGELRTTNPELEGFRIQETDHCFVYFKKQWYRYNRLWRVSKLRNKHLISDLVVTNLAPVLYKVNEKQMKEDGYTLIKI